MASPIESLKLPWASSRMSMAVSMETRQVMGILSSISANIAKKTALPHLATRKGAYEQN